MKRIIKQGSCPSLSAKSILDYEIGVDEHGSKVIRITSNSNKGYYSQEWVKLETILAKLETAKKPLTSFSLHGIFEGKSANTPGFVFAILYAEGFVERSQDDNRCYDLCDPKPVIESIEALIKSGADFKVAPIEKSKSEPSKTVKTPPSKSSK